MDQQYLPSSEERHTKTGPKISIAESCTTEIDQRLRTFEWLNNIYQARGEVGYRKTGHKISEPTCADPRDALGHRLLSVHLYVQVTSKKILGKSHWRKFISGP